MSDLERLVEISHFYGKDPEFVLAGGGNTSVKIGNVLYIKPSGTSLATITKEEFVAMDRGKVRATLTKTYSTDPFKREEQIKIDLLNARLDYKPISTGPRASVETALHELIDYKFVIHTHPNLINGLTCGKDGKRIAQELFGEDLIWIDISNPGFTLAKTLEKKLKDSGKIKKGKIPPIILIQNHGLIVSGDTIDAVKKITNFVVGKIKNCFKRNSKKSTVVFGRISDLKLSGKDIAAALNVVSPTLRGLLSTDVRKLVVFENSDEVKSVVANENGKAVVTHGTFSPDHMVYCKEKPLWIDYNSKKDNSNSLQVRTVAELEKYRKTHDFDPKIVFIQNAGMLAIGDSYKEARIATNLYIDFIKVAKNTAAFGGPLYMSRAKADFIEQWEVESYRRKLIRQSEYGRVHNRIAIVTGAGQGIGEGIARGLAQEGAFVVIADMNIDTAGDVAASLCQEYGLGKSFAVRVDVTKAEDIQNLVNETVKHYGGIDLIVSNAGILISGPTESLTDAQLNIMTSVNYQGFFKMVRETVGVLKRQNSVNHAFTTDIVAVSSKSGLQGSAANALYSGSKFGGIGLVQSFALEFIKNGVKVNAVCPGNYFEGPLWADPDKGLFVQYLRAGKVPGAKTIEDVKKFYEAKCPMGKGVSIADINRAIIYTVEQQFESGQAIPVTGGQVMLK